MLNYRQPTLFELDKALENFSARRRTPRYTISKTERFPMSRSSSGFSLPPGHYKVDCFMPTNRETELLASRVTRVQSTPKFSFYREQRVDADDFLKGISPKYKKDISNLGPGQYPMPRMGTRTFKSSAPSYSI
mmetsp:Transcript_39234/g.112846  ORF Transcript_39234/g.112846 Transcript_39234/m.112846 type:complete len:133 (-) Transcript_39234:73-471(-)